MGCLFLLQGIFPTPESNPSLLYCRQILYRLSYEGSPKKEIKQAHFTYTGPGGGGSAVHRDVQVPSARYSGMRLSQQREKRDSTMRNVKAVTRLIFCPFRLASQPLRIRSPGPSGLPAPLKPRPH